MDRMNCCHLCGNVGYSGLDGFLCELCRDAILKCSDRQEVVMTGTSG